MKYIEVGVIFVPKVIHTYILVQGFGLGFGLGFTETLKFGFRFHQNQKSGFVRSLISIYIYITGPLILYWCKRSIGSQTL